MMFISWLANIRWPLNWNGVFLQLMFRYLLVNLYGACWQMLNTSIWLQVSKCVCHRIVCSLWSLACWDRGSWISWTFTVKRWYTQQKMLYDRYDTQRHRKQSGDGNGEGTETWNEAGAGNGGRDLKKKMQIVSQCTILSFFCLSWQCVLKSLSQINETDSNTIRWVQFTPLHEIITVLIITCVSQLTACLCQITRADASDDVQSVVRSADGYIWTIHLVCKEDQGTNSYI